MEITMPALSASQLENIANQTLDFYVKNKIMDQSIQDKPLLKAMREGQKQFPGGKETIRGNVKLQHSVAFEGYENDDEVTYTNPNNVKQYSYPWKELHGGIGVTHTELKKNGITVENTSGSRTTRNSGSDAIVITDLFEDKLQDMDEGLSESMNEICWRDGTQDAKAFPGVLSILTDDPTTGVVGGLDRASLTKWRHRTLVNGNRITPSRGNQTLSRTLRQEVRQLKKFGGKPSLVLCGSKFLEALDFEIEAKGSYTMTGFMKSESTDIGMAEFSMRGVGTFLYDPTLDDLGYTARAYFIDPRHLYLRVMSGQDMKTHNPERPHNKYVLYRGVTWTGGMVADMLNCHGVYEVNPSF